MKQEEFEGLVLELIPDATFVYKQEVDFVGNSHFQVTVKSPSLLHDGGGGCMNPTPDRITMVYERAYNEIYKYKRWQRLKHLKA
jgi:hypothetical protein